MKVHSKGRVVEEDGWTVIVDNESTFMADQVRVRVLQREDHGAYFEYGPDSASGVVQRRLTFLPGAEQPDDEFAFELPAQAASLIARALLETEPASERLTNKLEVLLDAESARVDRLIDLATRPTSAVTNHAGD